MTADQDAQTTESVRLPRWDDPEIQAAWQREVDAEVARVVAAMNEDQQAENVSLTAAEQSWGVGLAPARGSTLMFTQDAVERIVTARLRAHIERERPVIKIEGVPQALRVAARLDAGLLGDAWDTIQPSVVAPPPWSYLRRFLHALADGCEQPIPPVQTSGVGADTGEAGCLPSPPSPRGGPPPRPTPEPRIPPVLPGEQVQP